MKKERLEIWNTVFPHLKPFRFGGYPQGMGWNDDVFIKDYWQNYKKQTIDTVPNYLEGIEDLKNEFQMAPEEQFSRLCTLLRKYNYL